MKKKNTLLLTNDDGFLATGITHLYESLKSHYTIIMVAPEEEQSGVGHSFTFKKPLYVRSRFKDGDNVGYSVSGTPSDCVKIALGNLCPSQPDIIISGINNGNNTGIAGFYSGTVAAAREGSFWHIPSIALSLYEESPGLFKEYASLSNDIIEKLLENFFHTHRQLLKNRVFLNINFPACHPESCAGIKITKQSLSFYHDTYKPVKQKDGTVEYWLESEIKEIEQSNDYDTVAIKNNFITVSPLQIDATAETSIELLSFFLDTLNHRGTKGRVYE